MLEIRVPAKFGLTPGSHRTAGHLRGPAGQHRVDNGSSGRCRPQRGAPPRSGEAPITSTGATVRAEAVSVEDSDRVSHRSRLAVD
jgi:hypothetical protein